MTNSLRLARRRAALVVSVAALCLLVPAAASIRAQNPPATPAPQGPIFRAGVNLVTVDAYPILDGKVVEGLTADDFQVFEDGKPQKVESFEFVRIEPTPEAVARDPNTVGESLRLAADPHNRVFVVYLDTHFVRLDGSHEIRRPLVHMLDGILAANDLFGVLVPRMEARSLTLARRVDTVETELAKHWVWGARDSIKVQPEGELLIRCYENPGGSGLMSDLSDPTPIRQVPPEILQRSYEDLTLTRLEELSTYLGRIREARSLAVVVTDGWVLYGRNESLAMQIGAQDGSSFPPGVFVGPGGKLGQGGSRDPSAVGGRDPASCDAEMMRLARLDDQQRFKELIVTANRNNVTFDLVNPSGLAVWDQNPASMSFADQNAMKGKPTDPPGNIASMLTDTLQSRIDTVMSLARNTDGIAIVNTNDLTGGLKRIVDENAAYYLLGYSSTNTKLDGKFRRIEVRVNQPKIHVNARRGYTAGTEGDRIATAGVAKTGPSPVDSALAALSRAAPEVDLAVRAAAAPDHLTIVSEIGSRQMESGNWSGGGDVELVITNAKGEPLAPIKAKLAPGASSLATIVPLTDSAAGPWTIRATVSNRESTIEDHLDVRLPTGPFLGAALLSRGSPSVRSALLPVADARFRRTERVHIEWPVLKSLDRREARLLARDGQPLAVAVAVTEREIDGHPSVSADVVLGPLGAGDYVIELVAGAGAETERQLVAIRVVQ